MNRTDSEIMLRVGQVFRFAVFAVMATCAAAAEPQVTVPSPPPPPPPPPPVIDSGTAVTIEGWGTLQDPAGGATAVQKNGGVELTVPGEYRDLWPGGAVNAPRLLQQVKGDFAVQVRVNSPVDVTGKQLTEKRPPEAKFPYLAACLLVWHDEANFVRLERASSKTRPHRWGHQAYDHGELTFTHLALVPPTGGSWLRIARKQGVFHAWYFHDGEKQWTASKSQRIDLPDEVSVGISLVNTTNSPFTVRFEQLKVEQ